MKNKQHPYELRLRTREHLPWFLVDIGIARKGENCEKVGAEHTWYNQDDNRSACYYCRVTKDGQLWEND